MGPVMKRAALAMALAAGFLVGGAVAQTPPDDKEPIPPRSIQLTAEQHHVIKEIVLKDMYIEPVPAAPRSGLARKYRPRSKCGPFHRSWPRRYRKLGHTNSLSPRIRS